MITKEEIKQHEFHTLEPEETLSALGTSIHGLSSETAASRLVEFGKNELEESKKKSLLMRFMAQFKELMVIVLIVAAVISGAMGEWTDTAIILLVVIINAVLGVAQESKAEKALEALKKMSSPSIKLLRDGQVVYVQTAEAVPGDILLLNAGDFVPADARLIESASLKVEESALTGESVPSEKHINAMEKGETVIGDRLNMVYSGTSITYGRGTAVITNTGMQTEVGRIAGHLNEENDNTTPLQKKMTEMSKVLTIVIVVVAVIMFIIGVFRGRTIIDMFLTAISLSVAAIPEGLPAVISIVLAIGVQKMAKKNAIIRQLSAVETLGSTQIICSDKTGTLTQNKMTVAEIYVDQREMAYEQTDLNDPDVRSFVEAMVLCDDSRKASDAVVEAYLGDPTETALAVYGDLKGLDKTSLDSLFPRIGELPFDSGRKLMSTIHHIGNAYRMTAKGAPDVLLARCTHLLQDGNIVPLTEEIRARIIKANSVMASKALRVLAVADRIFETKPENLKPDADEVSMTFLGLVGMIDPPRLEAKEAVEMCVRAGIMPIMITGDHRDTAAAIARELNILKADDAIITGVELNAISDEDFESHVERYSVYARVSPEHKVRIVDAWQKKGKVVAMTGDGVNDAPAIRAADIGIGMGITGTDVSKGVANMVLSDDNFATIVSAVEEGRKIYANISKTIQFLLSSNTGEVITLFVGTMLNWTVLLPIHILWINLITDTLPALALGMEKAEDDVMEAPPRDAKVSFFSEGVGFSIAYRGIIQGMITLFVYWYGNTYFDHKVAMTMAFATLGMIQLAHALNSRSMDKSLFRIGFFTNGYVNVAILISGVLQLGIILVPGLNTIFKVVPLNGIQWAVVAVSSFSIIPIVEIIKLIANLKQKKAVRKKA